MPVDEKKGIISEQEQQAGTLGEKRDEKSEGEGISGAGAGAEREIELEEDTVKEVGGHLNATEDDILEAKEAASAMSLGEVQKMMKHIVRLHDGDPNFPFEAMQSIKEFISNRDIAENPHKHEAIIEEMKLEAALITNNSPYAEVRAVVDNHDDPTTPVSTVRAWVIGLFFSAFISFVNQLFSIRLPSITLTADVAQLLAFPVAKAWERWVPRGIGFTIPYFGTYLELNPGKFNKKEHMFIAIMASVSIMMPYSNYIFWVQYLPFYFNQAYARSFGYMFINNLATNFMGYGLAGIARRFLVYPSYCVWPASLVTIALNSSLHDEGNVAVPGPFKKIWTISRYRFFFLAFALMFVYFWIPNYLFSALSVFAWMTWIAPNNRELTVLTGMSNGMGLFNPLPTFDWNIVSFLYDPLMYPSFSIFNLAAGMFVAGICMLGLWYTNAWNTAYLPINSNQAFDHTGALYDITQTIDERGLYDHEKFMKYSFPYLSPAMIMSYCLFFCVYSAVITHILLYHRYEVGLGFKGMWKSVKGAFSRKKKDGPREHNTELEEFADVHARLMRAYPEVSEWWYLIILVLATALGCTGLAVWPTWTSPAVPLYGIALCLIFIVPVGIVTAMTGVPISLNVLAEFFGGLIAEGNALALNFFKCYGYVTCQQTITFSNDLKLAHYLKIPPRITFWGQVVATFVSTIVSTGVMVFQMGIKDVCTPEAPNRFTCPITHSFFTASVMWGTIGPRKTFGAGAPYQWLLMGFPIGAGVVLIFWGLKKMFPKVRFLRQVHIVAVFYGGVYWGIYNFSYLWPAVPVAWFSWHYIRSRYLGFWSKYNFVLSAAFSAAIALSAVLQFFSVQWTDTSVVWWGNTVISRGCEGLQTCLLKYLPEGGRFYPWWDLNAVPSN